MSLLYGRDVHHVFFIFPTVAVGRRGPVWFIEVAWLWLAVGVIFSFEED